MFCSRRIVPVSLAAPAPVSLPSFHVQFSPTDGVAQLETAVRACVGSGSHCQGCKFIARYLEMFMRPPYFVHVSWAASRHTANAGGPPKVLDQHLSVLTGFADRIRREQTLHDAEHARFVAVVTAFVRDAGRA